MRIISFIDQAEVIIHAKRDSLAHELSLTGAANSLLLMTQMGFTAVSQWGADGKRNQRSVAKNYGRAGSKRYQNSTAN